MIIPNQFCEDCAETESLPVPATREHDSWGDGSGGGGFFCDNCSDSRAEQAYESRMSDYWGGDGVRPIQEQCEEADRQRRELRKYDYRKNR